MSLAELEPLPIPEPPTASLIPESVRERVTIAPPAEWVALREADASYRPDTGAPYTFLLLDHQHSTSRHARYRRSVARLETMIAVRDSGQWKLDAFDPATERLTIHSISVQRDGGRTEQAQMPRLRFLQREGNLERIYSIDGAITIVVLLEDVRVGDILDSSFTIETIPRLLPDRFWSLTQIPSQYALREFHWSVRFPAGDHLQWKGHVDLARPIESELGAEREWDWKIEKIPAAEAEPCVPTGRLHGAWIQVSDCASWSEVAEGYFRAWAESFDDAALVESARLIAREASSPGDRIERALTLVQDDVRYLSVNIELGGQIPAAPGVVLQRRFGDCKDKAFLLAHLLRWLGIPARPVLVHSVLGAGIEELLPMPSAFNHAIVEFELNGHRRWVDGTTPLQGGSALERPVQGYGLGLPISAGVTSLEHQPLSPSNDLYQLKETFRLDTTGRPPLLRVVVVANGKEAEALRQGISMEGLEAVARSRERMYRQIFGDVRRLDMLEWRDDRDRNEVVLAESYELPNLLQKVPNRNDFLFAYGSHLVQSLLPIPNTAKRLSPFVLPAMRNVEHWIDLESPALPRGETEAVLKRDKAFRFSCEFKKLFGRWAAHYTLRTYRIEVPPHSFNKFKEKVQELWPSTQISVVLPAGVGAARGKRRGQTLLPSPLRGQTAREQEEDATAPLSGNWQVGAARELRSAPVPALGSMTGKAAPLAFPPLLPALDVESAGNESAAPAAEDESGTRRRRSKHRRRSGQLRRMLVIGLVFLAVAVVVAIWVLAIRRPA